MSFAGIDLGALAVEFSVIGTEMAGRPHPERAFFALDHGTGEDVRGKLVGLLGILIDSLTLGDGDQGDRALNLLPQAAVTGGGRAIYRISAVMLLVALLLGATGLYLPLRHKQDALAELGQRLAQLQIEAREAHALEEKVQDLLVRGDFLLNEKRDSAAAVELLAEVTRLLPDDTWLLQFAWRNGSLRLSGYSKNPSSLIRLLEASDHLTQVRFGSPVTMDPRVGLERFNITACAAEQGTL